MSIVWITAILASLGTAGLTFVVNYCTEMYKRHKDKQALASAFLAEIKTIVDLTESLKVEERYRTLLGIMQSEIDAGRDLISMPPDGFMFPTTVYDKCVDKIGAFDVETAALVVRFYSDLIGLRACLKMAMGSSQIPTAARMAVISFMLELIESERAVSVNVQKNLDAVLKSKWVALPFSSPRRVSEPTSKTLA